MGGGGGGAVILQGFINSAVNLQQNLLSFMNVLGNICRKKTEIYLEIMTNLKDLIFFHCVK